MYICPKNNDEVISNKNEFISILRNDVHRRGRETVSYTHLTLPTILLV